MAGEITGYKSLPTQNLFGKNEKIRVISFKNTKNETITFRSEAQRPATVLFELIDKYSTLESPNITSQEVIQLRTDISKEITPVEAGSQSVNWYNGMDFIFNTYTNESSDGGKEITPKEITHIFEAIYNWTKKLTF